MNNYMKNIKSSRTTEFQPHNPEKYKGNYPIIMRSKWESKFSRWCDMNEFVLSWSSEPVAIPYFDKVLNKNRRYFPDFLIKVIDKKQQTKIYLIEVKPKKDCKLPRNSKKKSKNTKLYEQKTYFNNKDKFQAAIKYCFKKGWIFKIITEKELFNK